MRLADHVVEKLLALVQDRGLQPGQKLPAERQLAEELGVSGVSLSFHERFFFDQPGNRLWCAVFSAVWDGPLRLQPEEVSEARFVPLATALDESRTLPYCPDSLAALNRFVERQA